MSMPVPRESPTLLMAVHRALASRTVRLFGGHWLFLCGLILIGYLANPNSPGRAPLPFELKVNLIAGEMLLLAVLAAATALVALAGRDRERRLRRVILFSLYLVPVGFLATSLSQAFLTSYFAGWGSLRMMLTNPVALVQHSLHFHPLATVLLPAAVGLAAFGLVLLTDRLQRPTERRRLWPALAVAVGLIAAYTYAVPWSLVPFDVKNAFPHPRTGQVSTLGDYLNELYLRKTAPLTTLVGEVVVERDEALQADPAIPVEWKEQIPIGQYAAAAELPPERAFNVIVLLVESLRSDELRALGGTLDVMPHLDEVAAESLVFSNHYTTASHSNYADLGPLSSHYPLRSHETHVYPKNPTYPRVLIYDVLKELGYRTAIISSQNENWGQMINYLSTPGLDDLWHSDNFEGETYVPRNDIGFFSMSKRSGKVDDRHTVDRALRWIGENGADPFFIYMNLQNSHFPFEVGPGFERRFGPAELTFEPRFNFLERDQVATMRSRYRDSLAYVDAQIGRLIAGLRASGEWERTILVVSGDTGQAFMEHGFSGHANQLFNEVLQTPLILRVPGAAPGHRRDLVHHLDVPPTVLSLLGLPPHPSFQGRDLLAPPPASREVYLVVQSPFSEQYAIVRDGWKLIHEPFSGRSLLFDLHNDPAERHNRVASEPERAAALRRRLDTWRDLQIDYYRDADRHLVYYPPVLGEGLAGPDAAAPR